MCENFLTSFSPSNINITAANNFCHQDCARYLINLLNAVVKDCGIHPADMVNHEGMVGQGSTVELNASSICPLK